MEATQNREGLARRVKDDLQKAKTLTTKLRKSNSRLLVTGVVSSGASALVAGITAAQGPVIGEGTMGWRIACTVAAVLAFGATVCTGLVQQLKISERLAEGNQCFGRLNALDTAIVIPLSLKEPVGFAPSNFK